MLGYFAFPPTTTTPALPTARVPLSLAGNQGPKSASNASKATAESPEQVERAKKVAAQRALVEEKRRARLDRERKDIYLSELEWVRSGGILRDAQGRRDKARTEEFKKEIRLQEEERKIMDTWESYQSRFRAIQSSTIAWDTIPWPVLVPPSSPADLDPASISEFIFATFKVRGVVAVRKDRLRTSILRWHPDKFAALISRAAEDEQSRVAEGVNAVFRSLRQLQDEEKQGLAQ